VSVVPVDGIVKGQHACALIGSAAVHDELIAEFVATGLERRERVVYLADDHSPDRVLRVLHAGGVATAEAIARGQLVVVPAHRDDRARPFDPGRRVAALNAAIDSALDDGFSGFRSTAEQRTTLELPPAKLLLEYETGVGALCGTRGIAAMCQYDTRLCTSPVLDAVARVHTHVVRNPLVSRDEALRLTPLTRDGQGNAWFRVAGEADISNCALLLRALEEVSRPAELHLDLSRLHFVDLRGVDALRELAECLGSRAGRLILHHPPASLRRIVDTIPDCLPGVEMRAR
jgi:anti-anti-sigma regulatory factor